MKKFISILVAVCLILCLTSCSVVAKGSKNYVNTTNRLIPIATQTDLYYDKKTKIVYIIFNECAGYSGYGYMSPYYADNGKPYIYNAEADELEKIE